MADRALNNTVKSPGALLKDGVLGGNPLLRLGLGLCPALAVTTRAANGLGLGVATACVLVCTSLVASLLGKVVSEKGRLPVFLLVSALFATVARMILRGWFPALSESLGIYAPLIAVSCLILSRADFAAERGPASAVADAVGMGVGYICGMTLLGVLRELIGCGTIFGAAILPAGYEPMLMLVMPAGGFLALGILMGIFNAISAKNGKKEASK